MMHRGPGYGDEASRAYVAGMKPNAIDPIGQPAPRLCSLQAASDRRRIMSKYPTIEKVETILVDLPTIRPHELSMTTMRGQTLLIVRIVASDGVVGLGEGTTIGGLAYGAESPEGMKLAIDTYIAPVLEHCDPDRVGQCMAKIGKVVRDNHFAKCAIETALLDAFAKRRGLPLSDLFGGRFRDRLPIVWTLASGDTARDIAEAQELLDRRRHKIFKLKVGPGEPKQGIMHVEAIKRALGDRAGVRVDANQSWSEATAAWVIAALEDAGCDLVEQPIALSNRAGMARLAAAARVPIMADEALHGPEAAFDFAAHAAADVFAVKIAQSGGLFAAFRVAAIADAAGIGVYGGTMLEGGVATVASAHLFATFPDLEWGTELFGPLLLSEEILTQPLDYSEFSLAVPCGHGLGIELDEDRLQRFRRDRRERSVHVMPGWKTGS
jgi:muconate cycloisomerase